MDEYIQALRDLSSDLWLVAKHVNTPDELSRALQMLSLQIDEYLEGQLPVDERP